MAKYGNLPKIIERDLVVNNTETMLYLYLPIKLKGQYKHYVPEQVKKFQNIVDSVRQDLGEHEWKESYVYITIKAMFVVALNTYQRPGWHSDGFMTDDLNYIWCDHEPTEFYCGPKLKLSDDHNKSLVELEDFCNNCSGGSYSVNTLLRLDEKVIHRPKDSMTPCFRTFVKISVSDQPYALEGNSVNYIPEIYNYTKRWDYKPRKATRNCPTGKT